MFEKIIIFLSNIDCTKKNPIKYDKLLRYPGQSLSEKLDDISDALLEKVFNIFIVLIVFSYLISILNISISFLVPFLLFCYFIYILSKDIKKIRSYRLGRDGEMAVAQYLDIVARQLSKEYANMHIYHDLINDKEKFNIDHLVATKKGIFIFDTKTYRKDTEKENRITCNGKELLKNGKKITDDLVFELKGQAKWIQSELRQCTGREYDIIPCIVFVGWFVSCENIDGVYITTAKNIKNVIVNQYRRENIYDDEELKRVTSCIHKLATIKERSDICSKKSA